MLPVERRLQLMWRDGKTAHEADRSRDAADALACKTQTQGPVMLRLIAKIYIWVCYLLTGRVP